MQALTPASKEIALGSTLDLARVYPEPWQRLYIFPPYSGIATMETAMKINANRALKAAHLEERDDIALFVFVERREIQLVAAVRRGIMEIELNGDFLVRDRAHAQFKKTQKPGSVAWVAQP
ncbi:MAG: hypothetical protein HYZ45_13070 [Burkholderiales bacterium]|nr:hypothetical protein [Burkholderiales bacterium]